MQGASQSSGCEPEVSSRQRVLRQWTSCRRTVSLFAAQGSCCGLMIVVGSRYNGCTDQSDTRAPCHATAPKYQWCK